MEKKSAANILFTNPYIRYVVFGVFLSLLLPLISGGILQTSWMGIMGGTII